MRYRICLLLPLFAIGCASTPKLASVDSAKPDPVANSSRAEVNDREPTSTSALLNHSAFSIIGGIRIVNMGHNEGLVTLLRDRSAVQPLRAKCTSGYDHTAGVALQVDYGDDPSSKTLDLSHTNQVFAPQTNMSACLILLDKLLETSTYYPAYINFLGDRRIKVGF